MIYFYSSHSEFITYFLNSKRMVQLIVYRHNYMGVMLFFKKIIFFALEYRFLKFLKVFNLFFLAIFGYKNCGICNFITFSLHFHFISISHSLHFHLICNLLLNLTFCNFTSLSLYFNFT